MMSVTSAELAIPSGYVAAPVARSRGLEQAAISMKKSVTMSHRIDLLPGERFEQRECLSDGGKPHRGTIAGENLMTDERRSCAADRREMHQPDRLFGTAAALPGDAGNRDREIDRRMRQGTRGHRPATGSLTAPCVASKDSATPSSSVFARFE